ncbi:MAG: amidohydrolase family protein [Candidatus Lokiarchaeota archaeon]|nr:amidohydrolase family protein [Candidatus Lokiarchaeota archaeon]
MLHIRATRDIPRQNIRKGDEFHLYIVDFHHHMGREKSHQNTPSGAYEFYTLLWFEMQKISKDMSESDSFLFEPLGVVPTPMVSDLFEAKKSWNRLNHGWLIDRSVVFPYTDDYSMSGYPDKPSFHTSNEKIAGWTTRPPNSARLIGFCRVDPLDGSKISKESAVKELDYAIGTLGLRGLKLHPLAQLFVDAIEDDLTARVMKRAAEWCIPVIFDTRNINTAIKIQNLVSQVREDNPSLSNDLKVVLAHCGMNPGDSRLYRILRDPAIYGETSSLHGKDIPVLFEMAQERIRIMGESWSNKILFGTDYSFLSVQAIDLILFLLTHEFPGTLADAQKILAGNALTLINRPFFSKSKTITKSQQYSFSYDRAEPIKEFLIKLFLKKDIDLASLDVMIPPSSTWPDLEPLQNGGYNGIHFDSLIASLRKRDGSKELHLWLRENLGLVRLSLLQSHGDKSLKKLELTSDSIPQSLYEELESTNVQTDSFGEILSHVSEIFS